MSVVEKAYQNDTVRNGIIAAIFDSLQYDLSSTLNQIPSSSPMLYVCSASRQHRFYSTVGQSEGELTLGEDTDVTLPWKQASSSTGLPPLFVPHSLVPD